MPSYWYRSTGGPWTTTCSTLEEENLYPDAPSEVHSYPEMIPLLLSPFLSTTSTQLLLPSTIGDVRGSSLESRWMSQSVCTHDGGMIKSLMIPSSRVVSVRVIFTLWSEWSDLWRGPHCPLDLSTFFISFYNYYFLLQSEIRVWCFSESWCLLQWWIHDGGTLISPWWPYAQHIP